MKKAIITRVTHGKNKGQFKFTFYGLNGEVVGNSHPETYKQKAKAKQTLTRLFPDWPIVDATHPKIKLNMKL